LPSIEKHIPGFDNKIIRRQQFGIGRLTGQHKGILMVAVQALGYPVSLYPV
jgi:hypothetical protein